MCHLFSKHNVHPWSLGCRRDFIEVGLRERVDSITSSSAIGFISFLHVFGARVESVADDDEEDQE